MTRTKHTVPPAPGKTIVHVLLTILGVVLFLFGLAMTVATIAIMLTDDLSIAFLLPFTLATCGGGLFIAVSQFPRKGDADPYEGTTTSPIAEAPAQNSAESLGSQPVTAAPTPTPGSKEPPAPPADPTEDVSHLVMRSNDVFATLRDLVRHESSESSDKRHLATMLQAAGVLEWNDAPACEGGKLTRNTRFWIRLDVDGLTNEQYDTLVAAEGALGVNQDLPELRNLPLDNSRVLTAALGIMRSMCDQPIEPSKLTLDGLRAAYGTTDESLTGVEWAIRSRVCHAAECAVTPFRVVYDLRVNSVDGIVVIEVEAPRPRCMTIFASDARRQTNLARAYAFRLAVLLGTHALKASHVIRHVVVNCHEHGDRATLLSLDVNSSCIDELRSIAAGTGIDTTFPRHEYMRTRPSADWFDPVEPFVAFDDPSNIPASARLFAELDDRPATDALQRSCHVLHISDLGINENAVRIKAWQDIYYQLGTTTEQAVSVLVAARNSSADITVAEACNRTMQALVNGEIDLDDTSGLATLFVDGSALDCAVRHAVHLLDDGEGNADPATAVQILESALAPIEDMGAYLDDERNVYRYFGSISERVRHNLTVDERGRAICLVPDAYFNAHSNASIALGMLGESERALAHADTCLRLAPTSTFATMRKVRILEAESRVYEAADLIISALHHANTPRDAAVCHYRLAYMEWKLGREDLAAACYQRCLSWDTEVFSQAYDELNDLISTTQGLERPTPEQADALLAREGIPLGCVRTDEEKTLAAAVACMDAGVFHYAQALMSVLFAMHSDDVIMGVYRSLDTTG